MRLILDSRLAQLILALYLGTAVGLRYAAHLFHWASGSVVDVAFYLALLAALLALPLLDCIFMRSISKKSKTQGKVE